jgi:hypothetical protein
MSSGHPLIPGTALEGGIFAGRFFIGDTAYGLIVAPASEGELAGTPWGGVEKVAGALSYCDGLANTRAMAAAKSHLAQWAQALRIGSHDDWYVPSRLEALLAFGEVPDRFARAWYWTSTQSAGAAEFAWCQSFYGSQNDGHKDDQLRARAVRRFILE